MSTPLPIPNSLRAFTSVALPEPLVAEVQKLQRKIQTQAARSGVRWTRPEQLHLTLKFFGNVGVEQVDDLRESLRRAVDGARAFRLILTGLGCFPSPRRPSVLWLGIEGDVAELEKLQRQIEAQTSGFGSHAEEREFRPHLTIGRVQAHPREARVWGEVIQTLPAPRLGEWRVSELHLMRTALSSDGSSYTLLAAFPMSAGAEAGTTCGSGSAITVRENTSQH